jgi:hypothetical protein
MKRIELASLLTTLALLAGSGCATSASAPDHASNSTRIESQAPRGPGAIFETTDAAALDGLWFAYLEARGDRNGAQRARGGTVFPVPGGFSYAPISVADASEPGRVKMVLKPRDVAHFHTYPRIGSQSDRLNETHSPNDRANVDLRDPLRRSSYILTPSLRVQRYDAKAGEQVVGRIDLRTQGLVVAQAER